MICGSGEEIGVNYSHGIIAAMKLSSSEEWDGFDYMYVWLKAEYNIDQINEVHSA